MTQRTYRFRMNLSREVALSYYSGDTRAVRVRVHTGEIVQFPAAVLRDFMTEWGVAGVFELTVDADNRLVGVRKIGEAR